MADKAKLTRSLLFGNVASIETHVGDGTPFFDTMDALLCSDFWYGVNFDRFQAMYGDLYSIVVSGKWGFGFTQWLTKYHGKHWKDRLLWVPGNLRHEELLPLPEYYTNERFVFLDNSCYKGRTRDQIKKRLVESEGELADALIIYDGSREPITGMRGLYRYHK